MMSRKEKKMNFNLRKEKKMINKKRTMTHGFMGALKKHAETTLTDGERITVAKKKYLIANREEILQAVSEGYGYATIAKVATQELLETGVPATSTYTDDKGKAITSDTGFHRSGIKNFCEDIND